MAGYCEFCGSGPVCGVCGRDERREAFVVKAFVGNFGGGSELYATNRLEGGNLRGALRVAWELAGGIPGAWVLVEFKGKPLASLETNWRGECSDVDVFRCVPSGCGKYQVQITTPVNPAWVTAGVFAS